MVYFCDELDGVTAGVEHELDKYIPAERLEYAARYRYRTDRILSKLSYLLLRVGLSMEYGIRERPEIVIAENGKPHLADGQQIYFNISHCRKGAACAVSGKEVGVDIQDYVCYDARLAPLFMSREEADSAGLDRTKEAFTRVWALKESYGKYKSLGICYKMNEFTIKSGEWNEGVVSDSYLYRDYVVAVTSEEKLELSKLCLHTVREQCERLIRERNTDEQQVHNAKIASEQFCQTFGQDGSQLQREKDYICSAGW